MATYHYHYDPLDRLIQTAGIQRFYHQSRITTQIEGTQRYSVFQQDGQLLAQRRRDRTKDECHLLGTDLQQSVLHAVGADKHHSMAYNAYGHRPVENGLISLLGFNGERADPVTGHYLLGNGYRAFNPVMMRFNSPDSWSPFGRGGINSYGYCGEEPINRVDRNGHFFGLGSLIKNLTFALDNRVFRIMGAKVKRAFNVQKLAEGVYQYEYPSKRGATLVVQAHGDKLPNGDTAMF
ncbi:RHS repeat-associated core domain-containing protein [Pseudomonas lundensis]|uniref:RHS repeat-associated core domain-containing protein n=1 Tax=Pseudomonas lundensis TaxID=86185 RepID=UPI000699737D